MTSGQKVAVSLLLSVLLFAGFTVVAFAGLFDFIETEFYQPMVIRTIEQKIDSILAAQQEYIDTLFQRFETFASDANVKSFLSARPNADSIKAREKLRVNLMAETSALKGIRIIDSSGINIHYSTFASDVLSREANSITYKKYSDLTENSAEISYASIKSPDVKSGNFGTETKNRFVKDEYENRVIFTLPFYDEQELYAGTIAFYCDPGDLNHFLFSKNLIDITGYGLLVTAPKSEDGSLEGFGGYVFGLPSTGRFSLEKLIVQQWRMYPEQTVQKVYSEVSDEGASVPEYEKILFTKKSPRTDLGFISWVYDNEILLFPDTVRILLLVLTFITLFLVIYLLFNMKHDDMTVVRDRIRKFQLAFITESFNQNKPLPENLSERTESLSKEIKKSLGARGKKYNKEIDEILEHSWTEILNAMGAGKQNQLSGGVKIDSAELKAALEDILGSGTLKIQAASIASDSFSRPVSSGAESAAIAKKDEPVAEKNVVEERAAVSSAENIEQPETAEKIEPIEEAEPVEELSDVEELDEVEELTEAEPIEEAESVEELEEVEPAEEIEELEEAEPAEELSDVEELDEVEELTEAEPIEEAEAVEELEEVEPAEEIEEIEEAEPAEELSDVEDLDEVEELTEAEPIEEVEAVEELEEAEPATEAVQIEKTEPAGEAESAESKTVSDFADNEFNEKFEFSSPVKNAGADKFTENSIVDDFDVKAPDFSFLDTNAPASGHDTAVEVQYLGEQEKSMPFLFAKFVSHNERLTELSTPDTIDSIVQNRDGTFSVADYSKDTNIKIDSKFKKLVDSVRR